MKNILHTTLCALIFAPVIVLSQPFSLLKDINPGSASSSPQPLFVINNELLFASDDGTHGTEIWKTNGADATTILLKDINPFGSSSPRFFTIFNTVYYFLADDGIHGRELWKTDGTSAGTIMLKDINAAGSIDPEVFITLGNLLFFFVDDGIHGRELWKTDGTPAGTELVKDINPTGSSVETFDFPEKFVFKSKLVFVANDGVHGREYWITDGTEVGTQLVKDVNPTGDGNPSLRILPKISDDYFYFSADIGDLHFRLWKSDGTEAGTQTMANVSPSGYFTQFNSNNYFVGDDGTHGLELWKTDGTDVGTVMLKDINVGSGHGIGDLYNQTFLIVVDQSLYFIGKQDGNDESLWKTDGTEIGTVMVKNINPNGREFSLESSTIYKAINFEFHNKLIFQGFTDATGWELWSSDGTEVGTVLLNDVNPGSPSSFAVLPREYGNGIVNRNDFPFFYFVADSPIYGDELWRSDGTVAGTFITKDATPGTGSSVQVQFFPPFLITQENIVYFDASSAATGNELWRSDGTEAGTFMLKDIWPGPSGQDQLPNQLRLSQVNNELFISNANDGVHGGALWKTNGTAAGTEFVQDFDPSTQTASAFFPVGPINGIVYAIVSTSATGTELWVSSLAALPISLFDFTGILVGQDAKLNWKTTGEEKNSSYVLERSFDRINFSPVTTMAAKNNPGTNSYQYLDNNITQSGKTYAYYRIRQIEPNRQPTYSQIVAIRMSGGNYWVKIQPNPVHSQLNIQINSNKSQHATINIISMQGAVLMKKELIFRAGQQSISWDINKLPAGTYLLTFQDGEKLLKEKFIKQ